LVDTIDRKTVDDFVPVCSPSGEALQREMKVIETFRDKKDGIGGTVTCVIRNVPTGLGEPCFEA
jgi:chorismate synthase